ncbi:MAG: hypothetical protein SFY56_05565 [Bacteroidota bacterium]|nr:hypothetical protein [Bacteroidota bacterium]
MKLGLNTISIWFGGFVAVISLCMAVAFLFTDFMKDTMFGTKRIAFICVLLLYTVYRGFRIYQTLKYSKKNED